jgi:drug/metabolite transporter (DMT)-like permease
MILFFYFSIMKFKLSKHLIAIILSLLVTFLWSTSFILIKFGLKDIPPLVYAGLRYTIAFICLLPFLFTKKNLAIVKKLNNKDWIYLILLGLIFYFFTQGTQFIGLSLLPAVTVSLWLNFTPLIVAIMGIYFINEFPTFTQIIGIILFLIGIMVYFYPINLSNSQTIGLIVMTIGVLSNAGAAILGRKINRIGNITPLVVTVISMGVGALILLGIGLLTQGLPIINTKNTIYLLWLAVVNTAIAFTIWNYTLRTLTAMESSIINGTMLIQIALLAWIFLGEEITGKEIIGMFIAIIGAILVQMKFRKRVKKIN